MCSSSFGHYSGPLDGAQSPLSQSFWNVVDTFPALQTELEASKSFQNITIQFGYLIPSTPPSHINEPSPAEHTSFLLVANRALSNSPRNTIRVVCPFPTREGFATMAPHRVCHWVAPKEELTD